LYPSLGIPFRARARVSRASTSSPSDFFALPSPPRSRQEIPDIDACDRENPLAVTEYVNDIFSYWFRVEPDTQVAPNYMLIQTDINDKMRAILIDWLVEVHLKFKLMPETLFLTHNLIDRFLSKKVVTRKNLQLVGVTAMLLASKYEEIWAPEVRDFVYISDKAYTREQILDMEKQMLNTLGFHLTVPTPYQFLSRFYKAAGADKQFQLLASFIVESSLPDYSMLKFPASLTAAAATYVAMKTLGKGEWNDVMVAHTRYTEADIRPCANAMARLQRKSATASLSAVHKKYSNPKFMEVARLPAPAGLGEENCARRAAARDGARRDATRRERRGEDMEARNTLQRLSIRVGGATVRDTRDETTKKRRAGGFGRETIFERRDDAFSRRALCRAANELGRWGGSKRRAGSRVFHGSRTRTC
jgi:cyclin B